MEDSEDLKQENETIYEMNTPNKKSAKKSSLMKKLLIIFGVIITFIIAIIIFASMATSAPLKVSDEFIKEIQAGNSTAAYDLMSAEAQNTTSSSEFEAVVDQISPILNGTPKVQDKQVSAETGKTTTAEIIYDITGTDGTYKVTVRLSENNSKWQVQAFESDKK